MTVTSRSAVCQQLPTNVRIMASSDLMVCITVLRKRARVLCERIGLIFYPFESPDSFDESSESSGADRDNTVSKSQKI